MDIEKIAALLHIHEKAHVAGSLDNIKGLALHMLREHDAEAKEELDHFRAEEKKALEDAQAKQAAERVKVEKEDGTDNIVQDDPERRRAGLQQMATAHMAPSKPVEPIEDEAIDETIVDPVTTDNGQRRF